MLKWQEDGGDWFAHASGARYVVMPVHGAEREAILLIDGCARAHEYASVAGAKAAAKRHASKLHESAAEESVDVYTVRQREDGRAEVWVGPCFVAVEESVEVANARVAATGRLAKLEALPAL